MTTMTAREQSAYRYGAQAKRSCIVALLTSDAAIELVALRLAGRDGSDWEDAQEALKDAVRDAARSACSALAEMIAPATDAPDEGTKPKTDEN